MKYIKYISFYFLILFFAHINYCMMNNDENPSEEETLESIEEETKKPTKKKKGLLRRTGNKIKKSLKSKKKGKGKEKEESIIEFDIGNLAQEAQAHILLQLSIEPQESTLEDSIKKIKALSLTNKYFYSILNGPYAQMIVNNLAYAFNTAPVMVASLFPKTRAMEKPIAQWFNNLSPSSDTYSISLLSNPHLRVNVQDDKGNTPLMNFLGLHATDDSWLPIIEELLKNPKINIKIQNNNGDTVLHILLNQLLYYKEQDNSEKEQKQLRHHIYRLFFTKLISKTNFSIQNNARETPSSLIAKINDKKLINKMQSITLNTLLAKQK